MYDADGSIIESLFGYSYGVNGITFIEYVAADSPTILEATVILNGLAIPDFVPADEGASMFAGVATHELGHAFGLAHSQTNGQVYFYYDGWPGPAACPTPYDSYPSADDIETMYPFSNVYSTGAAVRTPARTSSHETSRTRGSTRSRRFRGTALRVLPAPTARTRSTA